MKKYVGLILVLVVVLLASYVTFLSPNRGGLELDADNESAISGKTSSGVPSEMRSLRTLYRTINLVQKRYIDAARIDSREMFVAAMRAVQGQIAQVIVAEKGDNLVVRLIEKEKLPVSFHKFKGKASHQARILENHQEIQDNGGNQEGHNPT